MRALGAITATLAVGLALAGAGQAILHGQPDGNGHPYVGLVTDGDLVCSGTAISATVFVTAAHCFDEPGTAVEVTFDEDAFAAGSAFHQGTWHPDPQFCILCGPGIAGRAAHDVAVVVLDAPGVTLGEYGELPDPGRVDTLPTGFPVTIVGYGIQDRLKKLDPGEAFTRFVASAQLVQSSDPTHDAFLKLSANPGQGMGGVCFGDSGGPNLAGDTNVILGVNSFLNNVNCAGVTYSYRLDTEQALAFVGGFLGAAPVSGAVEASTASGEASPSESAPPGSPSAEDGPGEERKGDENERQKNAEKGNSGGRTSRGLHGGHLPQ